MPRAAPLGSRLPLLRLRPLAGELAASAGRVGGPRPRRAGRRRGSTLELYTLALGLRREHALGLGSVEWLDGHADEVVAFTNGAVTVVANTGAASVPLPAGDLLLASGPLQGDTLPGDTTVWLRA